jgi:hypothetical protein
MIETVMLVISDNRFWIMPVLAAVALFASVYVIIDLFDGFKRDFYNDQM